MAHISEYDMKRQKAGMQSKLEKEQTILNAFFKVNWSQKLFSSIEIQ